MALLTTMEDPEAGRERLLSISEEMASLELRPKTMEPSATLLLITMTATVSQVATFLQVSGQMPEFLLTMEPVKMESVELPEIPRTQPAGSKRLAEELTALDSKLLMALPSTLENQL